jgi:hypothetical protein
LMYLRSYVRFVFMRVDICVVRFCFFLIPGSGVGSTYDGLSGFLMSCSIYILDLFQVWPSIFSILSFSF